MFCARFKSAARVRVRRDGGVVVEMSANDIGTGNQTVCALVAADKLGIPTDQVSIRWGDTRPADDRAGLRQLAHDGRRQRREARRRGRATPARGLWCRQGGPLDLAALMARANVAEVVGDGKITLPDDAPASFNGAGTPYAMQTWGATFVEVGVDRDLGIIRFRRAVARYSAGRIINPLTARSQMIGSIIWEWGKATMEASPIEPTHARFLAKNLSNVSIPVNADIPRRSTSASSRSSTSMPARSVPAASVSSVLPASPRPSPTPCSTPPASGCARSRSCLPYSRRVDDRQSGRPRRPATAVMTPRISARPRRRPMAE